MYNIQKNIWLTIAFLGCFFYSFGQEEIQTNNLTTLKTKNKINKIYENYVFDEEIVLLADCRKLGELNILIVVLDKNKEVVLEQIIGKKSAFDRPVGLIKNKEGYLLCANSLENEESTFKLYELDKAFVPVKYKTMDIENLKEVTTLLHNSNNQELILTASVIDELKNMYPRLIKYDLKTNKIKESFDLSNRTDKRIIVNGKDTVPIAKFNKTTKKYAIIGWEEVERYRNLTKECNQIKCLDNNCSEMILVGQEMTVSFTDFWVAKIKNGNVVWENIYRTRLGGDVAMDVFFDEESKSILVGGIGYNKMLEERKDHYYHYRVIQLDENGKLLDSYVYKSKSQNNTRCMYSQMGQIGDNYVISGYTQDKTYSGKTFEEDDIMTPANLYFVLMNRDGNKKGRLKTEKVIETESVDIPYSYIVLSDKEILLIFSKDEEMKILEVTVAE